MKRVRMIKWSVEHCQYGLFIVQWEQEVLLVLLSVDSSMLANISLNMKDISLNGYCESTDMMTIAATQILNPWYQTHLIFIGEQS